MATEIQETRETVSQTPAGAVRSTVVATDGSASGTSIAARIIRYVTGLLVTVLAIRFILSLLGANQGNAFADLIYNVSYPFAAPFFGLFGYTVQYGVARVEIETLVAMAVYAMVGFGIAKAVTIGQSRRDI